MMGAAILSEKLGIIPHSVVTRQQKILKRFGLPTSCSDVDLDAIIKAMALDKKVKEKAIQWVLLQDIGKTIFRDDVTQKDVADVIKKIID